MCTLTIDGGGSDAQCALRCNGGRRERLCGDVPFEFICEIARARALAEAGHVEGGAAAARHVDGGGVGEKGGVMAVGGEWSGGGEWWCWSRESGMADGRIKTEVEWPERAVGLLQAQPLSEPRSAGTEAAQVTCAMQASPGTLLLPRASGQRRCKVFREVRLHTPKHQETMLLRF